MRQRKESWTSAWSRSSSTCSLSCEKWKCHVFLALAPRQPGVVGAHMSAARRVDFWWTRQKLYAKRRHCCQIATQLCTLRTPKTVRHRHFVFTKYTSARNFSLASLHSFWRKLRCKSSAGVLAADLGGKTVSVDFIGQTRQLRRRRPGVLANAHLKHTLLWFLNISRKT